MHMRVACDAIIAVDGHHIACFYAVTGLDPDILHMGVDNLYPILSSEQDHARRRSAQGPRHIDHRIDMHIGHHGIEGRVNGRLPAIPVLVFLAGSFIQPIEPGSVQSPADNQAIRAQRITGCYQLAQRMLPADEGFVEKRRQRDLMNHLRFTHDFFQTGRQVHGL